MFYMQLKLWCFKRSVILIMLRTKPALDYISMTDIYSNYFYFLDVAASRRNRSTKWTNVAVSSSLPHINLRYVPWSEQPSHNVENPSHCWANQVPSRTPMDQPSSLVHLSRFSLYHCHHLPPQNHPLLRSRTPWILPPHQNQLLLRSFHFITLLSPRGPTFRNDRTATVPVVPPHVSFHLPWAQDLRSMDVRWSTQALPGRQPYEPSVNRRELCGGVAWCKHGT